MHWSNHYFFHCQRQWFNQLINTSTFRLHVTDTATQQTIFERDFSADTLYARNEWAIGAFPHVSWAGGTHRLLWHLEPTADGIGDPPFDDLYLIDPLAGTTQLLLPASNLQSYLLLNDGERLIAAEGGVWHIADLTTGRVESTAIPVRDFYDSPALNLSADETTLLLASASGGLLAVDLATLTYLELDVYFPSIGMGHYSIWPLVAWSDDGDHLTIISPDRENGDVHLGDNSVWDEDALNAVWQVDLTTGTVTKTLSFVGEFVSHQLSPDRTHIATIQRIRREGLHGNLQLIEVATGEMHELGTFSNYNLYSWSPDSQHFAFDLQDEPYLTIYDVQGNATHIDTLGRVSQLQWVDGDRFILRDCTEVHCELRLHRLSAPDDVDVIVQYELIDTVWFWIE